MGAAMRRLDWASTPVGPVGTWPESLRAAVSLLLASSHPMYLAWGEEYVQFFNDAFRPVLGSAHVQALGRSARETFAETWDVMGPLLERGRAGDPATQEDRCLPLELDGRVEERHFTLCYSALRREGGEPGGVLVTGFETTRHREEAARREQMARLEAEAANKAKDEFLAIVSHELRTPLNAILGWTHVARAVAVPQPEQTRRALEVIERNARIQTQIVSDVLDISRITSGQLLLNPSQVDANHVVAAALESVRPSADARKITLEAALPADPLYLWADPDRMQQVLCNLLSNAVKFTPAGGRVAVTLAAHGPDTEITVTDTGKGIAPEFLPHVFERFRQADSSIIRSHGGLGLGLAIVNHLVELHHGRVEASSAGPGRGATFRVVLPLMVVAGEPVPASGRPAPRLDGVSALVVDDHEDGLELVAMILTQQGASVLKAKDAGRALSLLRENRPSVLVSDLEMPGESGYDLMEKIRALPASQGGLTPAIALTAYARSDDRLRALMAGFQAHLSKPTRPHELASAVAGLVGQTRTP